MCSYSQQEDFECYNELIQTYQMVSLKFRYIKHYGARVGDGYVAKKKTNLNVSNGYSMYIDYK